MLSGIWCQSKKAASGTIGAYVQKPGIVVFNRNEEELWSPGKAKAFHVNLFKRAVKRGQQVVVDACLSLTGSVLLARAPETTLR